MSFQHPSACADAVRRPGQCPGPAGESRSRVAWSVRSRRSSTKQPGIQESQEQQPLLASSLERSSIDDLGTDQKQLRSFGQTTGPLVVTPGSRQAFLVLCPAHHCLYSLCPATCVRHDAAYIRLLQPTGRKLTL